MKKNNEKIAIIFKATIAFGCIYLLYVIINGIILLNSYNRGNYTEKFYNQYNYIELNKYVNGNKIEMTNEIRKMVSNESILNEMLNSYCPIDDEIPIYDQINALLNVKNFILANNEVEKITEEEYQQYTLEGQKLVVKISDTTVNKVLEELTGKEIEIGRFSEETIESNAIYAKGNYYVFEDIYKEEGEVSYLVRYLDNIDVLENDVFMLNFEVFDLEGVPLTIAKNIVKMINEGDIDSARNLYINNAKYDVWQKESVMIKELPKGKYIKYGILDKTIRDCVKYDEEGIAYNVEIVNKSMNGEYEVKLINQIVFIPQNQGFKIIEDGQKIVLNSTKQYEKGEIISLTGIINANEESIITLTEKEY